MALLSAAWFASRSVVTDTQLAQHTTRDAEARERVVRDSERAHSRIQEELKEIYAELNEREKTSFRKTDWLAQKEILLNKIEQVEKKCER